MNVVDQARIISEFSDDFGSNPEWKDFFDYNNLGVPYAIGIVSKHILSLSADGERYVAMTWDDLCDRAGVFADGDYGSLADFIMASDSPRQWWKV